MKILELNHVAIAVRDVERSRAFYRDVVGLPVIPRPAFPFPGEWFRLGTHQQLHLIGDREADAGRGTSMDGHFALRVEDAGEVAARLERLGVPFRGPGRRPDGAVQVFVTDPDGNVLEFCSALPA